MNWASLVFLLLISLRQPVSSGRGDSAVTKTVSITYTGNMGVLISTDKTSVLIDGLHEFYGSDYLNPPDSLLQKLFAKAKPFERLQWLLITHYHRDHFSKTLVDRFLQLSTQNKVIGSSQVVDSFSTKQTINAWNGNGEVVNEPSSSLVVKAYDVPHIWPQRHAKVQNLAYLVQSNGINILHLGDADSDPGAFDHIPQISIDAMVVPSWFIGNEKGNQIIEKFKPKKIIVTHIAPGEKHVNALNAKNSKIIFFETIGQQLSF